MKLSSLAVVGVLLFPATCLHPAGAPAAQTTARCGEQTAAPLRLSPAVLPPVLAARYPDGLGVTVELRVNPFGKASSVSVDTDIKGAARSAFENAVVSWAKAGAYSPARKRCKAVDGPAKLDVVFYPASSGVLGLPPIVAGVNFHEFAYPQRARNKRIRFHAGRYDDLQGDLPSAIVVEDVFAGRVAGKTSAIVVERGFGPGGYDEWASVFDVTQNKMTRIGELGEFNFFQTGEGPYPQRWFAFRFSEGKLYADIWQFESRCNAKGDWLASTYTVRSGRLARIDRLRHHRASAPLPRVNPSDPLGCTYHTPSPAEQHANLARDYEIKQQYARATSEWTKALRLDPSDAEARLARGRDFARLGEYGRALADYDAVIQVSGGDASAYNSRGIAYSRTGKYESAVADYGRAIEIDPKELTYYRNRAGVLLVLGRFSESAQDYEKSLKVDEKNTTVIVLLHLARLRAGTNDADEFSKNIATIQGPGWPQTLVQLYMGKATVAEALGAGSRAGDRCSALFFVAQWQLLQHDVASARKNFQQAQKTCPPDTLFYVATGAELLRLGGSP